MVKDFAEKAKRAPTLPGGFAGVAMIPILALIVYRGIAQLVEQRSPKPRAEGSSPSTPASMLI